MISSSIDLVLNQMTQERYNAMVEAHEIQEDELYLVQDANLDASHTRVTNVADPYYNDDAANKGYVDSQVSSAPFVKLSSDEPQEISSEISIGKVVRIGGIQVRSDLSYKRGRKLTQSCMLENRCFNYINLSSGFEATSYDFQAPALYDDRMVRDYLVRVKIDQGEDGASVVPVISFSGLGSSLPEGDEYPTWKIGGVYDLSFTEQPDDTWLLKVLDLTPSA